MSESEINPYRSPLDAFDELPALSSRSAGRTRAVSPWQIPGMTASAITAGIALLRGTLGVATLGGQIAHHGMEWPEGLLGLHAALLRLIIEVASFLALKRWAAKRWLSASACNLACLFIFWLLDKLAT